MFNLFAIINLIIFPGFEDLMRAYQKALPVVMKEESGQTPRFYVRCLVEMEDFINEVWEDREGRKNMSKNNSKSLTSLRQKLRKYNKDFEEDISKFRENPDQDDDEEDDKGNILSFYIFFIILQYIQVLQLIENNNNQSVHRTLKT